MLRGATVLAVVMLAVIVYPSVGNSFVYKVPFTITAGEIQANGGNPFPAVTIDQVDLGGLQGLSAGPCQANALISGIKITRRGNAKPLLSNVQPPGYAVAVTISRDLGLGEVALPAGEYDAWFKSDKGPCDTPKARITKKGSGAFSISTVAAVTTIDTATVEPVQLPTLNQWGLILLVAVLGGIGTFVIVRRRWTAV